MQHTKHTTHSSNSAEHPLVKVERNNAPSMAVGKHSVIPRRALQALDANGRLLLQALQALVKFSQAQIPSNGIQLAKLAAVVAKLKGRFKRPGDQCNAAAGSQSNTGNSPKQPIAGQHGGKSRSASEGTSQVDGRINTSPEALIANAIVDANANLHDGIGQGSGGVLISVHGHPLGGDGAGAGGGDSRGIQPFLSVFSMGGLFNRNASGVEASMLSESDSPPNAGARCIKATVVRADGQRVRITLRDSNMLRALYHINEVYPGNQSHQMIVVRDEKARGTC